MKTLVLLLIGSIAGVAAEPVRIGVYNSRAVALGFYRSPGWQKELRAKMAEREEAKQSGNAKVVEELEKWGGPHSH